jgi:hypothetical protein
MVIIIGINGNEYSNNYIINIELLCNKYRNEYRDIYSTDYRDIM